MQAVHGFFKQGPPLPKFETTTVLDPNNTDASNPSSVICVEQSQGRGRKRGRGAQADAAGGARKQHIRETWPGGRSKFCKFVLGKCNMDTQVGSAGTVSVALWAPALQLRRSASSRLVCSACSLWLSTSIESEATRSANLGASSAVSVALGMMLCKLNDPWAGLLNRARSEWKPSDLRWLGTGAGM